MAASVDICYPDFDFNRWLSSLTAAVFPLGGGGVDPTIDPTVNAGSAPVGTALYDLPASNAIYVSPTGSNGNPGTIGAPKQTLAAAMAAATTSGTTIVMRSGFYNEGGNTQTANSRSTTTPTMVSQIGGLFNTNKTNLTIQNYPGEEVWMDGSTAFTGTWSPSGGTWTNSTYNRRYDRSHTWTPGADDTGQGGSQSGGKWVDDTNWPCASWPDMIFRDGVRLQQVDTLAKVGPGKYFVNGSYPGTPHAYYFQATSIVVGDDPNGHLMEYSNQCMLWQHNVGPITIRGIGIRRYASYGPGFGVMYHQANNLTMENVWLEDCSAVFVIDQSGSNHVWRHVTCRGAGYSVSNAGSTDNITYDYCDFQGFNWCHFYSTGPSIAAMKVQGAQKATCSNSIVSNGFCASFWTDRTVDRAWVYNCRMENVGRQGIDFEGASYCVAANCVIGPCDSWCLWINDSDQIQIWNCTFVDSNRVVTKNPAAASGMNGGGVVTIGQSSRRANDANWNWMKDGRQGPTSVPPPAGTYYDAVANPAHNYQMNGFTMRNCVSVQRTHLLEQGIFSLQSQGDQAADGTGSRGWAAFKPDMDYNVWSMPAGESNPWIQTRGNTQSALTSFNLGQWRTNTASQGFQCGLHDTQPATNPINSSNQLIDPSLHNTAFGVPNGWSSADGRVTFDIANLIGVPVGTKRMGAFLVGDA